MSSGDYLDPYDLRKLSTAKLLSYIEALKAGRTSLHSSDANRVLGNARSELSRRKKELRKSLKTKRRRAAKRRKGALRRTPFRVTTRARETLEVEHVPLDRGGYANGGRGAYFGYEPGTKIYLVYDEDRGTSKHIRAANAKEARENYRNGPFL